MNVRNSGPAIGQVVSLATIAAVLALAAGCEPPPPDNPDPIPSPNGLRVEIRPTNGDPVTAGQQSVLPIASGAHSTRGGYRSRDL